jgi:hypothetical protein
MSKRRVNGIVLVVVVCVALLALPMAVGAQPANGITSVKDGATVSGKVQIKGNASDPNFWKWQLDLLPGRDPNAATFLATETTAGPFSYTLDTTRYPNGDHALRLRVVHPDGNYSEYVTKLTIANQAAKSIAAAPTPTSTAAITTTVATTATITALPTATVTTTITTAPTTAVTTTVATTPTVTATPVPVVNGITSVKSGATVTGTVEIKGSANDPAFSKWQLDLLPGGDPNAATFLALGTNPGPFSYLLNTTPYPNGNHALRLRVVRPDGNYSEYVTPFTIANSATTSSPNKPAVNYQGG